MKIIITLQNLIKTNHTDLCRSFSLQYCSKISLLPSDSTITAWIRLGCHAISKIHSKFVCRRDAFAELIH